MKNNNKNNNNAFFNNKNSFDVINTPEMEYAYKNLPSGLTAAFNQNPAAMTAFENMDDSMKRKILDIASKVSSKKEMNELVQNISINNF